MGSLALFVAPSYAQFTINFDENGNGTTCDYAGSCTADSWQMGVDPNTNLTTLIYNLPQSISGGALGILDTTGGYSDVLDFFNDANGGGHMAYYSLGIGPNKADTVTNFSMFSNIFAGPTENVDGSFTYVAGNGDPAETNFYNGISTAETPEPGTIAPLAGALLAIGAALRRKIAK